MGLPQATRNANTTPSSDTQPRVRQPPANNTSSPGARTRPIWLSEWLTPGTCLAGLALLVTITLGIGAWIGMKAQIHQASKAQELAVWVACADHQAVQNTSLCQSTMAKGFSHFEKRQTIIDRIITLDEEDQTKSGLLSRLSKILRGSFNQIRLEESLDRKISHGAHSISHLLRLSLQAFTHSTGLLWPRFSEDSDWSSLLVYTPGKSSVIRLAMTACFLSSLASFALMFFWLLWSKPGLGSSGEHIVIACLIAVFCVLEVPLKDKAGRLPDWTMTEIISHGLISVSASVALATVLANVALTVVVLPIVFYKTWIPSRKRHVSPTRE